MPAVGGALCADTLLLPVELIRRVIHDPMRDAPGEKTGVEIAAANCPDALVLIRNLPGAAPRGLTPAGMETGPSKYAIRDDRRSYILRSEPVGERGFRLTFSDGVQQQVLYETSQSDEGGWQVVWAGDLDADQRPDLVLMATHKYSVGRYHLFLSGAVRGEALLQCVATFRFTS